VLKQDAENVEGLEDYGVFLGKHVKEYELAEQVLCVCMSASDSLALSLIERKSMCVCVRVCV